MFNAGKAINGLGLDHLQIQPSTVNTSTRNDAAGQFFNKVSQIVDDIRGKQVERRNHHGDSDVVPHSLSLEWERSATPKGRSADGGSSRRTPAEQDILDAEKFKATVSAPNQGKDIFLTDNEKLNQILDYIKQNQDDEFYHVTCHVDARLKQRIQNGEYIELETLIPKHRGQMMKEDQRLQQYVSKNGSTYWAPPERESRINGIKKWEQAFRVYAAIYCEKNPTRAVEIWQYIHTINSAAVSFAWENIYYYDITFRQMMAEKPYRSWEKTYSQLWHAAMCDPLPKNGGNSQHISQNNFGNVTSKTGDWRDRCCWRFNRGKCKKWNCPFDHRCTFCGSYSHNVKHCVKKNGNGSGSMGGKFSHGRRSHSRSRSPPPKQKRDKKIRK